MPITKFRLYALRILRSLWFTPAAYAVLAAGGFLVSPVLAPLVPEQIENFIGLDGVYDLLDVLASTLLAVAIFSMGTVVAALQAAASAATPRARPLLTQDRTAQNAISTFLGGFIFSIVGMVGLSTGLFDESRLIIFFLTMVVVLLVIVQLIRWLGRLTRFGDVQEAIDLVENAAASAFADVARSPCLGGRCAVGPPAGAAPLFPERLGFVQAVDSDRLAKAAEEADVQLYIAARPGAYVDPGRPILFVTGALDGDAAGRLRSAFVIGDQRTFESDPRFGLIVLSEIASRALSTGVNDPGTAIDVLGTMTRVLADWRDDVREVDREDPLPRLSAPSLDIEDILGDAFRWIARDGAEQLEVQIRIQKALATLVACDEAAFGEAARAMSREALARAEGALALPDDLRTLKSVAARIGR